MSDVDLYFELGSCINAAAGEAAQKRIAELGIKCPLIGMTKIRTEKEYWTPDPEAGEPYLVYPCLDRTHICDPAFPQCHTKENATPRDLAGKAVSIVDLVAFRPDRAEIYLRCGNVSALGDFRISNQEDKKPLWLFSNPTAWLAASCDGAVILDWKAQIHELIGWPQIVCDTFELGEKLEAELKKLQKKMTPKIPKIGILKE